MTRDSCVSRMWSAMSRWVWPASMNPPRATTSTDACSCWSWLGEVSLSNWKSSVGSCTGLAFRRTGPSCNAPLHPMIPHVRARQRSGVHLGDRLEDALRRDAVCRPDRLREERDPQLLDHPADVDDVGGAALGGPQGVEQVGVPALDEVDLLERLGVAGQVGRRLVEAVRDPPKVAIEVGQ